MSDKNWQKVLEILPLLAVAVSFAREVQQTDGEVREDAIENLIDALVNVVEGFAEKDLVDNAQLRAIVKAALDLRPAPPAPPVE